MVNLAVINLGEYDNFLRNALLWQIIYIFFSKTPSLIILLQILQRSTRYTFLYIESLKVGSKTIFNVSDQDNFLKYFVWFLMMVFIKII